MKLWEKGLPQDKKIDLFTVGNDRELDRVLAKYDILGSMAQAKMLHKVGLISEKEKEDLLIVLEEILDEVKKDRFFIEEDFEDIHSKIEFILTEKLGETGKKIHTARSRNDQILVDIHLYLKEEILEIKEWVKNLFDLLIEKANRYKEVLLPGYTHLQIAMPSSFGLWFSAYAESLIDDIILLNAAFKIADQNPLGSAAGYGSSFPIDRNFTTQELHFYTLKFNSVAAQMSRGKIEKSSSFAFSSLAGTLSKMAMDLTLYMSQNFNFVSLPSSLTTGSSLMPHKKNPDVFELIRAKCNIIQALPYELSLLTNNLPSGYHRDFQLLKEGLIPAIQNLKSCLDMVHYALKDLKINKAILEDKKYETLFTVDAVNDLVSRGIPFRDAYKIIGEQLENGNFKTPKQSTHTHEGSINYLCLDKIKQKMDEFF